MIMMQVWVLSKLPTPSEGGPYPCHLHSWVNIFSLTLAQFRRWSQRAARGAGVDRTKYGTTRRCTKDHFTHHTRMYSKTAVIENAAAMCRVLTKKKALLFSAAHAATPDAATRA